MIFTLYDDHEEFRLKSEAIIKKVSEESGLCYEVRHFSSFNKTFERFIEDDKGSKVYILDIEVPGSLSGIEVAKRIRKSDWNSIIIMITSHTELGYEALKAQIMLLDFISKYHDWETTLGLTLKRAIMQVDSKKIIVLESGGITHRVHTDDILYVLKDPKERKCTVKTTYDEIVVQKSMTEMGQMLDKRFYLSHRSCYINVEKVKSINWRQNTIHFNTGDSIDYLSRDRKKGLREYVRSN